MDRFNRYFISFILYAVIGWCYEVFLEVVVYRWGFTNRGVLYGPYCPVYGVGAMIFLLTIYPRLKDRTLREKILAIPLVFLSCMVLATALELATSYLLEFFTGSWPWQTYVDYRYNFEGRIALSPSVRFGLGGILFLYILQPLFDRIIDRLGPERSKKITVLVAVILIVDMICTFLL